MSSEERYAMHEDMADKITDACAELFPEDGMCADVLFALLTAASWGALFLIDMPPDQKQRFVNNGVVPELVATASCAIRERLEKMRVADNSRN